MANLRFSYTLTDKLFKQSQKQQKEKQFKYKEECWNSMYEGEDALYKIKMQC